MKKTNNRAWRFIYKLHRYLGLLSALVLIMLAITGIALNHTEQLKLDQNMIESDIILDWYGVNPVVNLKSYSTNHHTITQLNQHIYFDNQLLTILPSSLIGAVETEAFIVVAIEDALLLLSLQGELIEQIPQTQIHAIGLRAGQHVIIKSEQKIRISDDELLSWRETDNQDIVWSKLSATPNKIKNRLEHKHRTSILPQERVILDLHSGRLFGTVGVLIVDISGIFLIILALSGCAVWVKHKFRSKRH